MAVERYTATAPQGVNFTVEESQLSPDLWDDALNISFDDGSTNKVSGIGTSIDPALVQGGDSEIELVLPFKYEGLSRYAYGLDNGEVWSLSSLTDAHESVTPNGSGLQPVANYKWQGSTINGVAYVCKGYPFYYDTTPEAGFDEGRFKAFDNFPVGLNFKTLRTFGNYLVGLNTTDALDNQENRIWHSSAANDRSVGQVEWDPTPENDANWVYLGGEGGAIVDGLELKNDFIIYREKTVHIMSFIGGNDIFSYRQIFAGFGLLADNCVTEIEGQHFCLGVSDVYMHDGRNKTSVADSVVKDKLYGDIDPSFTDRCFVLPDHKRKKIWVCIPELSKSGINPRGFCTGAYVYDWVASTWSYRELPYSSCGTYDTYGIAAKDNPWNEAAGSWATTGGVWFSQDYSPANWGWIMAGQFFSTVQNSFSNGFDGGYSLGQESFINSLYNDINDKTYLGDTVEATATKSWISFGDDNRYKKINLIHPIIRGGGELLFDVGYSDYINGDIKWKTGYVYNKDTRRNKPIRCRVNGRYFHLKFTIPPGSDVGIKGYNIEYTMGGKL
jgi:hypothetical protein